GRNSYFGNRATIRLLALGKGPAGQAEIAPLLDASLSAARSAHAAGDAAGAKAAADRALRLTDDASLAREMLGVLRASYASLPAYRSVANQPLVPVARPAIGPGRPAATDRSHAALGAELASLGLYDEAVPELRATTLGARSPFSM